MAKYFLGSVGKAEAFRLNANGEMELAFVSKTLTDSGLNISTTKDDIRGGEGAPIVFSFYHDASVEITLTDIQFKTEYVTAQLGAEFNKDPEAYKDEKIEIGAEGVERLVKNLPVSCGAGETAAVWGAKVGTEDFHMLQYVGGKIKVPAGEEGTYCVRYLTEDSRARVAEITANIIPSELYLIISAPIFAGDACAASRGRAAGQIQFDIPRFLLNGGQEFSMNMSSNQTMSLSGVALSATSTDCEAAGGLLVKIREVIFDRKWSDGVTELVADPENAVGEAPEIYGITKNGAVVRAENEDLTFTPALVDGKCAQEVEYTVALGSISTKFTPIGE